MDQQGILVTLETIAKHQPNQWIPIVAALGGALVGGLVTFIPTSYLENRREKALAKQVQNSIVAEISALIRVVENRKYLVALQEAVDATKGNNASDFTLAVNIPVNYSAIYQAQCRHIGVLNRQIARDIINFYQLLEAVVQDIKPNGTFSTNPSLEGYQETLTLFKLAIQIGKGLEKK
ncbi:hypothetical protein KW459_15445 [Vibrio fluvialis]|nr:hypothetical protein [Vibrio fluvialis]